MRRLSSLSVVQTQVTSFTHHDMAINWASVDDSAIPTFFLLFHITGVSLTKTTVPLVDFRSQRSPAQSAPAYAFTVGILRSNFQSITKPRWIVIFRYLITLLTAINASCDADVQWRKRIPTTAAISGCVRVEMYSNAPIASL